MAGGARSSKCGNNNCGNILGRDCYNYPDLVSFLIVQLSCMEHETTSLFPRVCRVMARIECNDATEPLGVTRWSLHNSALLTFK